jgi:hypothetical protein
MHEPQYDCSDMNLAQAEAELDRLRAERDALRKVLEKIARLGFGWVANEARAALAQYPGGREG